ncbi:Tm-1-like ATP-binding domain-containing protein [Pseudoruegeria sp. HB172150]|uniref:Tm-1-like ATP-binding domain-containing protein n=1 Tax=Pseudoruegeria sp. HB172150 TaxID=2721164 RepID=UPI0015535804|nr:Tm-1-like ATP-binding domain-containing protein [Pseudoruegeria sp. HB172150]
MPDRTILIVGTYDTKQDELAFLADVIRQQGGNTVTMDVSVLGDPAQPTDHSKHDVAREAGHTIAEAIAAQDENQAMQIMARGAALLAARLHAQGQFDGALILGGTMGTDLALDVAAALPLGTPKYIVSTVAFSPLIPPERLPADIQMILWAGGLYGLNSVCRASLSQAAGAVLGAARAVQRPDRSKPLIAMTSFGKSVLRYMVPLKPALEDRGYEVAVFHATGMGGRAFENLAAQGAFACVMDFATQEVGNHIHGSAISAGDSRLTAAGKRGIPQIVAPGCYDLVDLVGWQPIPDALKDLPSHAHNRLLTSVVLDETRRRAVARAHADRLAQAQGPTVLLLPTGGCGEWDRPGADLHDAEGLAAFLDEMRAACPSNVELQEVDAHINDAAFSDAVLRIFDRWQAQGLLPRPD